MREINIRLNANRAKAVHTGIKIASGDKGIVFKIAVDELNTEGTVAKIVFKRSNGTSVEAGITEEEGVYSYKTLGNEFAVVGQVVADVKLYKEEERVSTCTFVFDVTSDTLDGLGNGAAGYSDTLERMKKSMEQAEADILAAKDELEKRAEEILQQMKETAENAEDDLEETEKKMADLSADLEALYQEYMDAFGNVGPFNPRGPYSETETYTVRDMVSYDNASWICYRNCTGETPSEDSDCWQMLVSGGGGGPAQGGDADTLGGHGADYFATKEELGNYLPKTGGTVNGNFTVNTSEDTYRTINLKNAIRALEFALYAGGAFRLLDATNNKNIIYSSADGTTTFAGTASGNLPIDGGGKVTAANVNPIIINSTVADDLVRLPFQKNGVTKGFLGFVGTKPVFTDASYNYYEFLHTGNKPTGTYTGNGDAAGRTIATGGIGKVVAIWSKNGTVLVSPWGAICFYGGTVVGLGGRNVSTTNNGVYIRTTNEYVNESGVEYTYQVL